MTNTKANVSILTVWKVCPICGNETYSRIKCNDNQYMDYNFNYHGLIKPNKPIQDIFPQLSKMQREHLKSGICRKCQKNIF